MKGQGAAITNYEGDPFDLDGAVDKILNDKPDQRVMVLRDWIVLVLTAAKVPMTTSEIVRVIAQRRTDSLNHPDVTAPPTKQNVNAALQMLRDRKIVEVAGTKTQIDTVGRTYHAAAHQLVE